MQRDPAARSEVRHERGAWAAFREGAAATVGLALGGAVFGLLFGVLAIGRGLDALQAMFMSATVFAGAAQVAVLEIWREPLPYLPIGITAALVCCRHVLMGVTLYDTLSYRRSRPPFAALFLLTDANWVLTARNTATTHRIAFFVGSGLAMYIAWMVGTLVGVAIPGLLDDATISGLRLGGALFIAILLCIFLRGSRPSRLLEPAIAAAVAVLASRFADNAVALIVGVAAAAGVTLQRELRSRD